MARCPGDLTETPPLGYVEDSPGTAWRVDRTEVVVLCFGLSEFPLPGSIEWG